MKAKKVKSFLNEVGEASSILYDHKLNYSESLNQYNAVFTTESGVKYNVKLKPILNYLEIDFSIDRRDEYSETNAGELFRVMSTLTDIVKEVFSKYDDLDGIRYEAHPKGGEKYREGDKGIQRDKLFRTFIKKSIPNVEFIESFPTVFAKKIKNHE